jgi:hypothetical protein
VFENKTLRRIFGVTGRWRNLHTEELHNSYSSPDVIRMIKEMRVRWAGHVARMEEMRDANKILVRKPEGGRPLINPRLDMIILKWIGLVYTGFIWLRIGTTALVNAVMNLRVP